MRLALNHGPQEPEVVIREGTAEPQPRPVAESLPPSYGEKYVADTRRLGMMPDWMASTSSQAIRVTPTRLKVL